MKRQDVISYHRAIGTYRNMIMVENFDTANDITEKINKMISDSEPFVIIEVFNNEENIESYTVTGDGENTYNLWNKKEEILSQSSIENIAKTIETKLPSAYKSPYDRYVAEQLENNKWLIKSMTDKNLSETIDSWNISMDDIESHILGKIVFENGTIEFHAINPEESTDLYSLIKLVHDDRIKIFIETMLQMLPKIKNENRSKMIKNAAKICDILMDTDYYDIRITEHEKDMTKTAVILCELLKYGWKNDDSDKTNIVLSYPSDMADIIKATTGIIDSNELNFIANCVESHLTHDERMTVNANLPKPDTECKNIVQLSYKIAKMHILKDNL